MVLSKRARFAADARTMVLRSTQEPWLTWDMHLMLTPPIKKGVLIRMHHRDKLELQNDFANTLDEHEDEESGQYSLREDGGTHEGDVLQFPLDLSDLVGRPSWVAF